MESTFGRGLFTAHASESEPAFTWLGQHSFILTLGSQVILVDPFLAEMPERLVPPMFEPAAANGVVSLVCCTHDHIDHIDPVAVGGLAQTTECTFLAPRSCRERMLALGVPEERLLLLDDRETVEHRGISIIGVKAAHELFETDADGHHAFLGLVLQADGVSVYHAGDTVWWEGLQARLRNWKLDAAFLPINGRDAVRYRANVLGNMTYQEAADLAGGLDIRLVVPTHYGMFESNTENPQLFADYIDAKYPELKYQVPVLGRWTVIPSASTRIRNEAASDPGSG